jgi:hypothetical protein
VEKIQGLNFRFINWTARYLIAFAFVGCASKVLDYAKAKELQTNVEYDERLKIKVIEVATVPTTEIQLTGTTAANKPIEARIIPRKVKERKKLSTLGPRQPDIEDAEGFLGRRPVVDPFRIGEKITLGLSYFKMTAGYMDLEVLPFVEVNGQKSYSFKVSARSNSFFSNFYAVDDFAMTYLDYESLLPFNFAITVKESKQLADIRSFFDWKKMKGHYWEKRVTADRGEKSKSLEWDIKPFSQNVISAVYYLRTFNLRVGKKIAFRVADDGKNIVFTGDVLRQEDLDTDIGVLKTVVVRPTFEVDGAFAPVGEILMWLTDDDRKFLVRIESKIKIGTIVGKVKAIEKGLP